MPSISPSAPPRCSSNRSCVSVSAGRPGERVDLGVDRRRRLDRHRARHRPRARGRQPAFGARRAAPCCIRCRSAMRSTSVRGIRDPRGMLARRVRRRHACGDRRRRGGAQSDARGRALPSRRRGDGGGALCGRAVARWPTTRPISAPRVIDMGAGTTTMAVFSGGRFIHADGFALGGKHVTMDFARGLNARISDAERIKTLYGSVLAGAVRRARHDRGAARSMTTSARRPQFVSRAQFGAHHQAARRGNSRNGARPAGGVAVRGRAARPRGAHRRRKPAHRACRSLRRRSSAVRCAIGRPLGIAGLPEAAKGPAFAVAAGLLVYPQAAHLEHFEPRRTRHSMTGTGGYIARVGRWLRESF